MWLAHLLDMKTLIFICFIGFIESFSLKEKNNTSIITLRNMRSVIKHFALNAMVKHFW